jgi:hypothetical protein
MSYVDCSCGERVNTTDRAVAEEVLIRHGTAGHEISEEKAFTAEDTEVRRRSE